MLLQLIHCIDELSDWQEYRKNGAFSYLMQMKEQGVVKHIGLSSHTPATIQRVLDEASVDMLMFSVNPGYDYQKGEYAKGSVDERSAISPFGKALTQGDSMAAEHYRNLEIKADACVQCGHCKTRCPFHVKQESRMKEIAAYFQ